MALILTWLGQAGFLLKNANESMVIDPFCGPTHGGRRLYDSVLAPNSLSVDLAVATHDHWDHFDPVTYRDYISTARFVGPTSCIEAANNEGFDFEMIEMNRGEAVSIGNFDLKATFAEHIFTEDCIGVIVRCDGFTLYFSGDTLYNKELDVLIDENIDIAFVCINGKLGNMNFMDAAALCESIKPKLAVPIHYDLIEHNTEDPETFMGELAKVRGLVLEKCVEYDVKSLLSK